MNKNDERSVFDLGLNAGSNITSGAKIWNEETVKLTNGAGTVTEGTPLTISSNTVYGWVTKADGTTERVVFNGANFTISDTTSNDNVCVRYYTNDATARQVTIYADMMPSTIRLVMVGTLASSDATTNQIGTVQIEVPRASMTGAFTLSMTSDAVSQTPLSVRALASTENVGGCTGNRPVYATITEKINGTNWYDGVVALAIEGGDFSLTEGGTKALQVFAVKNDGTAPFLAPISGITFASSSTGTAEVEGGTVSAIAAGTATIKATVTAVPSIDANVIVTVTAA